jgi:hypothetical protein
MNVMHHRGGPKSLNLPPAKKGLGSSLALWSQDSIRVWVRSLESQNAERTLSELLAPSFGERLSLKRLVANLKEISESEDYTFEVVNPPRNSSEALSLQE